MAEDDGVGLPTRVDPPISRNAPCPCGSGLRYKACHGDWSAVSPDAPEVRLRDAAAHVAARDWNAVRDIAYDVLRVVAEHPLALQMLGQAASEEGDPQGALELLVRAVRAMPAHVLSPAEQYLVWTSVNYMFTQALSGVEARGAADLRARYQQWDRSLQRPGPPSITVLAVLGSDPSAARLALRSVTEQVLKPDQVVVVHPPGAALVRDVEAELRDAAVRYVLHEVATGLELAARLNAGVHLADGDVVVVLEAPHAHAPGRIAAIAKAAETRDLAWGFTNAAFIDTDGKVMSVERDAIAVRGRRLLDGIAEAETVGFTFVHQEFVALSAGNLWFRRDLYHRLHGFREWGAMSAWDFCLRALWEAEPAYLPAPLYHHSLSGDVLDGEGERGQAQVAVFRDYYARASRPESVPPNPFAPSVARWGLHFLKTPFHVGHVLAFGVDDLGRIASLIDASRMASGATVLTPGINLVGFAYGEFGLGESLRALATACDAGGIPFVVKDVDMRLRSRQADRSIAGHVTDELRHKVSLYCVNPDMMKPVFPALRTTRELGGRNIGYWYWELDAIPAVWADALSRVDEIWVATEFVADAMRRATDRPVLKIPPPLEIRMSRPYARAEFGLPERTFLFLFSFDFNSFHLRKNPEGAVRAFCTAFPASRRDVGLVVKSINGNVQRDRLGAFMEVIGGDDRILVKDGFLSRDEVYGMESVVDAYVSLHRAEGLGLGMAESMVLGKPVIATGYSGNLEFMDPQNSCLVGYRLVPIAPGEYLYDDARFRWADPDIDQAAAAMRRLVDEPEFRTRIAAAGQATVSVRFSRERTADLIRRRLAELALL